MNDNPMATMDQFAAKYLLRALQALGVADDSMSESDVHGFAKSLREQMDIWIGDLETIRHLSSDVDQVDFLYNQIWYKECDALRDKLGIDRSSDLPL